ncbi:TrmH family RNA methyltransferase [Haloimpatiens sp. FM7315]|uniref:TrmH family RNA methyltransferase n=1 Tax=Haloimpatiens sp. FM7315 TaxID=3298609 RepID=UPI003977C204
MENFQDLSHYTVEEKEKLIIDRYKKYLKFAGKKHSVIKMIENINNNSKPNPEKLCVVEGIWGVGMLLKHDISIKYFIFCPEEIHTIEAQRLMNECVKRAENSFMLSKKVFDNISERGNTQGILCIAYMPKYSLKDIELKKNNIVLVLDGLEIPGNVGTILRSADATKVDAVIINNRKTRLTHPKLIRSSMGACFNVPIIDSDFEETSEWLKNKNFNIVLTDTKAENKYSDLDYENRIAIVMGSERYGISEGWYKEKYMGISIPMLGDCDSLNVGIAATIVLYESSLKNKGILDRISKKRKNF